jgi:hypothetical protein
MAKETLNQIVTARRARIRLASIVLSITLDERGPHPTAGAMI